VANVEQRDLVQCLFALLPNSERGLLEMRFFHNMSYRKMGHEFGVSCHCVRQAVEKILKECRRIMKYIDFGKIYSLTTMRSRGSSSLLRGRRGRS